MKSMASGLTFSKIGLLKLSSLFTIRFFTSCLVYPGKGFLPVRSIYDMTPMLQTSTF
jgi:hypothetical protein